MSLCNFLSESKYCVVKMLKTSYGSGVSVPLLSLLEIVLNIFSRCFFYYIYGCIITLLSKSYNCNSLCVVGLHILFKFSLNFFCSLIISSSVRLPYYVKAILGVYCGSHELLLLLSILP